MTNNVVRQYKAADRMSDLIRSDYRLLQVMSRFGLVLGFGDRSVDEVCRAAEVDTETFLAVAAFMQQEEEELVLDAEQVKKLSLTSLLHYLNRAHSYFLDFSLPAIRRKLIEAIDCSTGNDLTFLIIKYFDEYAAEVREHMEFENQHEFAYVRALMEGDMEQAEQITHNVCPVPSENHHAPSDATGDEQPPSHNVPDHSHIMLFTRHQMMRHKEIDRKLSELKNIIIKYHPSSNDNPLLNAVLFDIFICEEDLAMHCRIEDNLFVPAVRLLEKKRKRQLAGREKTPVNIQSEEEAKGQGDNTLSQREREIVTCVVKGMTNKEIADTLFLSIHTVITHRRNIARKLEIHSAAGLTIYAIINNLVDISEVKV